MIELIKNIANIIFFLTMATIAILSYIQARKTLFAPIKTETFKLQLKSIEDVLLYFQNKSEHDFINMFDYENILNLNSFQLYNDYISLFFASEIKINEAAVKERLSNLVGGIASADYFMKNMKIVGESPIETEFKPPEKITNPAIILATWQDYEYGMIGYTQKFIDSINDARKLAANPILPKNLRSLINEFIQKAEHNHLIIGQLLTDIAKQLPKILATSKDAMKFTPAWIYNEYNSKREPLDPFVQPILLYINEHLKIDKLQDA